MPSRAWSVCRILASGGRMSPGSRSPWAVLWPGEASAAKSSKRIDQAIAASVDYAFDSPADCLPYIREHSQETAAEVVQSHIALYVNDFSRDLGLKGTAAIAAFLKRGRQLGVLPAAAEMPIFRDRQ